MHLQTWPLNGIPSILRHVLEKLTKHDHKPAVLNYQRSFWTFCHVTHTTSNHVTKINISLLDKDTVKESKACAVKCINFWILKNTGNLFSKLLLLLVLVRSSNHTSPPKQ